MAIVISSSSGTIQLSKYYTGLLSLPNELLLTICSQLDKVSLVTASRVCRDLRPICKKLKGLGAPFPNNLVFRMAAARLGYLEIMQWNLPKNPKIELWNSQTAEVAAASGHVRVLEWIVTKVKMHNCEVVTSAAKNGQLKVLQWLYERKVLFIDVRAVHEASRQGHIKVLEYFHEKNCPKTADFTYAAALRGNVKMLQALHEEGVPLDEEIYTAAAEGGSIEVLEWLKAHDAPWDDQPVCFIAAKKGHLAALKWFKKNFFHGAAQGVASSSSSLASLA